MCFQCRTIQLLLIPSKVPVYCILIWRIGCCCCWLLLNWDNILIFSNTKDFIQPSFCPELFLCFVSYLITNHSNQEISKNAAVLIEILNKSKTLVSSTFRHTNSYCHSLHLFIRINFLSEHICSTKLKPSILFCWRIVLERFPVFSEAFDKSWKVIALLTIQAGGGVMLKFLPTLNVLVLFTMRVCL